MDYSRKGGKSDEPREGKHEGDNEEHTNGVVDSEFGNVRMRDGEGQHQTGSQHEKEDEASVALE